MLDYRLFARVMKRADSDPAWSAAMDFALAILPWHVVLGLNMKRKEKLTVACGLSLGILYVEIMSSLRNGHAFINP